MDRDSITITNCYLPELRMTRRSQEIPDRWHSTSRGGHSESRNVMEVGEMARGPEQSLHRYALSGRHRLVLSILADCGGSLSIVRLARHVAVHLACESDESVPSSTVRRYYVELRALLDDLSHQGLVEYCATDGNVMLTGAETDRSSGPSGRGRPPS